MFVYPDFCWETKGAGLTRLRGSNEAERINCDKKLKFGDPDPDEAKIE